MKNILASFCSFLIFQSLAAQTMPGLEKMETHGFERKLVWGISYNQCWSSIQGNPLPASYFAKPSLGFLVSSEYFPLSFLGLGIGAGYQQRGAGILHQNRQATSGPSDSTYRERLRFNTIEFPISVIVRTPKDVVKGLRISASFSAVPLINLYSRNVLVELEPSVQMKDIVKDVSAWYFKNDMAYQLSFGPEIDSGGSGIFKIHVLYSKGTTNVYKAEQGKGYNQTVGLRLAILF